MSKNQLRAELILDDGKFRTNAKLSQKSTQQLEAILARTAQTTQHVDHANKRWTHTLRDSIIVIGGARAALHNLSAVALSWQSHIINNNAEIERSIMLFKNFSSELDALGRTREAESLFDRIIDKASKAPFSIKALTDEMVKLKTGGIQEVEFAFDALTDAVAAFGGTEAQLHRSSIAIQQMMGKGVISMEELRQQLGEAIPNAAHLMAQGLGTTYSKLVKLISEGKVKAEPALMAMFKEMDRVFGDSALRMMNTYNGLVAQIKSESFKLSKEIGDAGYFDAVKEELFEILQMMKSPEFKDFASDFGQGLAAVVRFLGDAVKWLAEWGPLLIKVGAAWLIVKKAAAAYAITSQKIHDINKDMLKTQAKARLEAKRATSEYIKHNSDKIEAIAKQRVASADLSKQIQQQTQAEVQSWRQRLRLMGKNREATHAISKDLHKHYQHVATTKIQQQALSKEIRNVTRDYHSQQMAVAKVTRASMIMNSAVNAGSSLLGAFGGVAGIAATALTVLAFKWWENKRAIEETNKALRENKGLQVVDGGLEMIREKLSSYESLNNRIAEKMKENATRAWEFEQQGQKNRAANIRRRNEALIKEYQTYTDEITNLHQMMNNQVHAMAEAQAEKSFDLFKRELALESEEVRAAYTERQKELSKQREKAGRDQKKLAEIEKQSIESQIKFEQERLDIVQKVAKEKAAIVRKSASEGDFGKEFKNGENSTQLVESLMKKFNDKVTDFVSDLSRDVTGKIQLSSVLMDPGKGGEAKKIEDKLSQFKSTVTKRINRLQEDLRKSREKIDPLFAGNEVADINLFIKNLKADADAAKVSIETLNPQLQQLREIAKTYDHDNFVTKLDDEIKRYSDNLKTAEERERESLKAMLDGVKAKIQAIHQLTDAASQIELEKLVELKKILESNIAEANKTALDKMLDDWVKWEESFEEITTNAFNSFADNMADMLATGKADWKSFADDVIKQIMRMIVRWMIAKAMMGIFGDSTGGTQPTTTATVPFANGGIMSSEGNVALKKYARGGIATKPQLALFGEGSMAEAYVPLPDGRSIPVTMKQDGGQASANVQVNVINEGNQEVTAEQSGTRFDGEKYVVDVVLRNLQKPGTFRDSFRGLR